MSNEKREQQMMAAADAYVEESEEIYNIVEAITDFCAGWRAADKHPAWVSVEDELPPLEEHSRSLSVNVIGTDGRCSFETYYNHSIKHWKHNDKVTHWMPLPEPPAEEGGSDE